jgi:hypothetical protein
LRVSASASGLCAIGISHVGRNCWTLNYLQRSGRTQSDCLLYLVKDLAVEVLLDDDRQLVLSELKYLRERHDTVRVPETLCLVDLDSHAHLPRCNDGEVSCNGEISTMTSRQDRSDATISSGLTARPPEMTLERS